MSRRKAKLYQKLAEKHFHGSLLLVDFKNFYETKNRNYENIPDRKAETVA